MTHDMSKRHWANQDGTLLNNIIDYFDVLNSFTMNLYLLCSQVKTVLLYTLEALACACSRTNADQHSGYCSFPSSLQDVETSSDLGQRRKTWISRTLYTGATDSWTRRTVVTVSGGRMRIEHLLHASCR